MRSADSSSSVCQSELVAELFQQQGDASSAAEDRSIGSGRRAAREHKLTVGSQVSSRQTFTVTPRHRPASNAALVAPGSSVGPCRC